MARYITTHPVTIPAGTVFEDSDAFGEGGLEMVLAERSGLDACLFTRVFMGRRAALEMGTIEPERQAPRLSVVGS
jgi:hypothetical protein